MHDDPLAAIRRSDQVLCEQVAQWEPLEYGVAYWSNDFPDAIAANQLRDVWLADLDGPAVLKRAESFFAGHGVRCRCWVPAAGQDDGAVADLLLSRNWRRIDRTVMTLSDWSLCDVPDDPAVRVLPARAMRRAYLSTHGEIADTGDVDRGIAQARLDDTCHNAFVAVLDGEPAGHAAYQEVGDVASVPDIYVHPRFRRRGIGLALAAHLLRLGRRLLPKLLVAAAPADDAVAHTFLNRCGFQACGATTTVFVDPQS